MDSITSIPADQTPAPDQPTYKDRSTGLIVFGVLTLLIGVLCALFVPLMLFGMHAAARANPTPTNTMSIVPALFLYAGQAVVLIWLGIGSMQARRWARALLLILSWTWLVMGVLIVAVMGYVLPKTLAQSFAQAQANSQHSLPPGATNVVLIFTLAFMSIIMVVLPVCWVLFYKSPHVKATCEARHPIPCWTDRCPLPVLALCLWLLLGVPMLLLMPFTAHGVMPFFGRYVSGLPGSLICVVMACVWIWVAWRLYRLDMLGWWVLLIALVLLLISSVLTYSHHNLLEMYRLMGYPETQLEQMQKAGLPTNTGMLWITAGIMLPFLGYLLFIRKYLSKKTND